MYNSERGMRERDFKTKAEHWGIIIDYLEEYPNLLNNRFDMSAGENAEKRKLWADLANQLNSLGYGFKSPDKWQLAIGRWKSKVKAKATLVRREQLATGGGSSNTPQLTNFDERLMAIAGWKSVTGDGNKELGLGQQLETDGKTDNAEVNLEETPSTSSSVIPSTTPSVTRSPPALRLISTPRATTSTIANNEEVPKKMLKIECKKKILPTKHRVNTSTERSRKFVSLAKMHTDTVSVLNNININLNKINTNLEKISNVLKII